MKITEVNNAKINSLSMSGAKITEITPIMKTENVFNNRLNVGKSKTLPAMLKNHSLQICNNKEEKAITKPKSKSKIPVSCSRSRNKITDSESTVHKGVGFFKKIVGIKKPKSSTSKCLEEVFVRDYSFDSEPTRIIDNTPSTSLKSTLSLATIDVHPSCKDLTLSKTINEMISLEMKINESELHIKDLIIKYINDNTEKSNLCELIEAHSKLLLDSKLEASNITTEAWFKQNENYIDQIHLLQTTVNSLLKQNRELLAEHDELTQKNHKKESFVSPKNGSSQILNKGDVLGSSKVFKDLTRRHSGLKNRLETAVKQIEDLEHNMGEMHRKNGEIEKELLNSNMKLQAEKINFDRLTAKQELEIIKLQQEISSYNTEIKQSKEIADLLVKDIYLTGIKIKSLPQNINLESFMKNDRSLTDFINLGRSYLNTLFKEINERDVEINKLKNENENLLGDSKELKVATNKFEEEINLLKNEVVSYKSYKISYDDLCLKYNELLEQIGCAERVVNTKILENQQKVADIKNLEKELQELKENEHENRKLNDSLKADLQKIEEEKMTLQAQVNGLAHVLSASGGAEIAKELANLQEKFAQLQGQYISLLAEKRDLVALIESNKDERQQMLIYQKKNYEQLEEQCKILESLKSSNVVLKEQLEKEKNTVLALQSERVRHLEEKSILTALYERLKEEISKIELLEGNMSSMNIKANQFKMIAEYNKQLGEKLENQVAERDIIINELQKNVKTLATKHAKSDKEKNALSNELAQISEVKEDLITKLSKEVEKNMNLDKHRKKLEISANLKVKELETMYKEEHDELKSLVKSSKNIIKQRDSLILENKNIEEKVKSINEENQSLMKKIDKLKSKLDDCKSTIKTMEKDLADKTTEETMKTSKFEDEIDKYKRNCDKFKEANEKLLEDNRNLKTSIEYLQADITKLRTDLDLVRSAEMESKNLYEYLKVKCEKYQDEVRAKKDDIARLLEEKVEIQDNLASLHKNAENLKERILIYESEKARGIMHEKYTTKESKRSSGLNKVGDIEMEIYEKDEVIIEMQEKMRFLEEARVEQENYIMNQAMQHEEIFKENEKLQSELTKLSIDFLEKEQKIKDLENQIYELETECANAQRSIEENNDCFEQYVEEIQRDSDEKVTLLSDDSVNLTSKLTKEIEKYNTLQEDKKILEKRHRDLAMKLLKAVQALVAQKVFTQKNCEKIKSYEEEIASHQSNIEKLNEELRQKQLDISSLKNKLEAAMNENENLNKNFIDFQIGQSEKLNLLTTEKQELLQKLNLELIYEEKYKDLEVCFNSLQKDLEDSNAELIELNEASSNFESKCARLEFQKAESVLRLHETQVKLQSAFTQIKLQEESLKELNNAILKLVHEGLINYSDYSALLIGASNQIQIKPDV